MSARNSETSSTNPLEEMPITRILLSESASKALLATGERAFLIAAHGSGDDAGRVVIHAVPVAWKTALDASDVLLGRKIARNIPKPRKPS